MESPLEHARQIAPSVSWDILLKLKRCHGMTVRELMAELKMSYMGLKQHCEGMKKRGYLETCSRANSKQTGRPEKVYRITDKGDALFPQRSEELCLALLNLASQIYGPTAPERLLHQFFQQKASLWEPKLKGRTIVQRAQELVKLRNASGWICECRTTETGSHLLDHHSPLAEVGRMFPSLWDMEARMLGKLLGGEVEREVEDGKMLLKLPMEKPRPEPRETLFDLA
jgi:predicted ArsR family transcriptional regulator